MIFRKSFPFTITISQPVCNGPLSKSCWCAETTIYIAVPHFVHLHQLELVLYICKVCAGLPFFFVFMTEKDAAWRGPCEMRTLLQAPGVSAAWLIWTCWMWKKISFKRSGFYLCGFCWSVAGNSSTWESSDWPRFSCSTQSWDKRAFWEKFWFCPGRLNLTHRNK